MGAHAKFAPSASGRWLNCPGSITLCDPNAEEGPPSSYAWEGTICHEISAICLKENKAAAEFSGQVVQGVSITPELVDAMQMYIDEVKAQASEMKVKGGKIEFEVKITGDCWGTMDAALWNTELLTIADAKFGKGVIVEAEGNTQMRLYAIGTLKALKEEGIAAPKQVKMMIVQPRTVNPVREETITVEELQEWAQATLAPSLARLRDGDTTCNPGEKQCQWCPVSPNCAAQASSLIDKAAQAFAPFTSEALPEIDTSGSLLLLVGAQAELALSFKHIENWMKSIKEDLMTMALAGDDIPGFKMVAGRSVRKWGMEETELVSFLGIHDINPYGEILKTPPALEKEIGKKRAKEIDLDSAIIKPEGSPTLVPETDKRPALAANVEKDFEDFADEAQVKEIATGGDPIIIDDDEDTGSMSLMKQLSRGAGPDSAEPEVPDKPENVAPEHPTIEVHCPPGASSKPPAAPKRKQVLEFFLDNPAVQMAEAADALGMTENSIRMHLRYLNERDGYGYTIFKDGSTNIEAV